MIRNKVSLRPSVFETGPQSCSFVLCDILLPSSDQVSPFAQQTWLQQDKLERLLMKMEQKREQDD